MTVYMTVYMTVLQGASIMGSQDTCLGGLRPCMVRHSATLLNQQVGV